MNNRMKLNTTLRTKGIGILAALLMVSPFAFSAKQKANDKAEENLIVNFDDIKGVANVDAEWIREDLLETAFYNAAESQKVKGFKLQYNGVVPKNARNYLDLRIVDWRRTVGNMYEVTVVATYYNTDGKKVKLGTFHGYRSGIDVTLRRDIGDRFVDTAEDAFTQVIRKLESTLS